MSVRNVKIRFNLDKEMTAGRMTICKAQRNRTARRSFLLYADLWNYLKGRQPKMLSLNGLSQLSERKLEKVIRLADYYNLCRHPLHKHPLKKKTTLKPKKRYSLFLTAFKVTFIPAFDGTVMAISKGNAPTNTNGATILQY